MSQITRTQGLVGNVGLKAPVAAATTGNITLYGEQTIDGVAVVTGDRVLVKDQTNATENGIYDVDTGTWSRSADFDGVNDIAEGSMALVVGGSTNINTMWRILTSLPIIAGTLAFVRAMIADSSLIGFLPSGTGAVPTTVQNKLRESISVKDFGALGNNVNDDTLAIQACLDAAYIANKAVLIPAGIYKTTAPLRTKVPIYGEGEFISYIRPYFVGVGLDVDGVYGICVTAINITYDGSITPTAACKAIRLMYYSIVANDQITQAKFSKIAISNSGYGIHYADSLSGGVSVPKGQLYGVTFEDITVYFPKYTGIHLYCPESSLNVRLVRIDVEANVAVTKGFYLFGIANLSLISCIGSGMTSPAGGGGESLQVGSCSPLRIENYHMENIKINGLTFSAPIQLQDCHYVELSVIAQSCIVNSGGTSHILYVDDTATNVIVTEINQTYTTLTSGTLRHCYFNNPSNTTNINIQDAAITRALCTFVVPTTKAIFSSELVTNPTLTDLNLGISFGGGTTGITYSFRAGAYYVIGNLVFFQAYIGLSSKGSSTGNASITGLPFTANATTGYLPVVAFRIDAGAVGMTGFIQGYVGSGGTNITLENLVTGTATPLTDAAFTNNTTIHVTGFYMKQ